MAVGFPAKTTYANGDVFSASDINDTNGTLNLATGAQWAAGKNKIINGEFDFWQRGTSFSGGGYCADRFLNTIGSTSGFSATQQTFTPGTAPVAGYENQFYLDIAGTLSNASTGYIQLEQRIEDVRTLAGQTITLSFWAKGSASGTINTLFTQNFGSGGSAEVLTATSSQSITTSWQRFTVTLTLPSISGKTVGTSSFLKLIIVKNMGSSYPTYGSSDYTGTLSLWGVQVEQGSTATSFQTASGTIQGELALCQRYFCKTFPLTTTPASAAGQAGSAFAGRAYGAQANCYVFYWQFPVAMRATPTITTYSPSAAGSAWFDEDGNAKTAAVGNTSNNATSIYNSGTATANKLALIHATAEIEL
jgi:hypothetical protein